MGQYRMKGKKERPWKYQFQFEDRTYKKEGFSNKYEAMRAEVLKRGELQAPAIAEILLTLMQELGTEYLKNCTMRGMAHNTIRQKAFVYRAFQIYMNDDIPAVHVTPDHIDGFLSFCIETGVPELKKGEIVYRQVNGKTVNRYLRELSALFNFATSKVNRRKYCITENPSDEIEKWPEDQKPRYIPPADDIHKVRLVAAGDESDLIETLYFTGARVGEIAHERGIKGDHPITWEDVNFEQGYVVLSIRKRGMKGIKRKRQQIGPTLKNILFKRWKHRDKSIPYVFEFGQYRLKKMMERLCDRAGVKRFTFHAIRHFVSSILADKMKAGQISLKDIQDFLGHERVSTTETYIHSLTGQQGIVDLLESDDSEKSLTQSSW